MKDMSEIFAKEPSVQTMPDDSEAGGGEPQVAKPEEGAKPSAPAAEPRPETQKADDSSPKDLEGYEKALKAAREDAKKERKKQHELERELAELRGYQKAATQFTPKQSHDTKPAEAPVPVLDPADLFDPEKARKFFEERDERVKQALKKEWQEEREKEQVARLNRAEKRAKAKYADWDEHWLVFEKALENNPRLYDQMVSDDDPGEFVYQTAKTLRAFDEAGGSIEKLREKLKQEARDEVLAEMAGNTTAKEETTKPPLPKPSIASARGTGAGIEPAWTGPRPMADILSKPRKQARA